MVLNSILVLILTIVLVSCNPKSFLYLENEQSLNAENSCEWEDNFSNKAIKLLRKKEIIQKKDNSVSIKLLHKGVGKNFIGIINCSAAFQEKKYLSFYADYNLVIFTNYKDLESIYSTFNKFYKNNVNELGSKQEVWNSILSFISTELLNMNDKIIFN